MFDNLANKFFTPLTPEEQARKDRIKAQQRRDRAAAAERRAELERQRLETLPYFRVREVREVLVQAEDMKDAIALASAAFKEGQSSSDHSIKWGKPFGVSGDTKGPITTVDIRAIEEENPNKVQGAQLSYNHGFGDGHKLGVENERQAQLFKVHHHSKD